MTMFLITDTNSCLMRYVIIKKFTILLYGHTHNSEEDAYYQKCLADMVNNDCRHVYKKEVKAVNVGCMKPWINYEPRTLGEILQGIE